MKKIILIVFTLVSLMASTSNATQYVETLTVNDTLKSLWFDTGITLDSSQSVTFHDAVGSWTIRNKKIDPVWGFDLFGPAGVDVSSWGKAADMFYKDEFVKDYQHGQLLGYIGLNPWTDIPNAFAIGTGTVLLSGLAGDIWLGFNDAASKDYWSYYDNTGYATVFIDIVPVPEPSTLLLFGAGLICAGFYRKRSKE